MITRMFQRGMAPVAIAALALSGCGVEGLINQYLGHQYTQPVSIVRGKVALPDPDFVAITPAGEELEPYAWTVNANGEYEVQLVSGNYTGLVLRAFQGQGVFDAFIPEIEAEGTLEAIDLDERSTASVQIIQGFLQPQGQTTGNLSGDLLCISEHKLRGTYGQGGPADTMIAMMERISGRANLDISTETRTFQTPIVSTDETTGDLVVEESPLNPNWLARSTFDYDGDGTINLDTVAYDTAYLAAIPTVDLTAPPDTTRVRVLFTVNFNEGQLNGACGEIERFRWVRNEPGRQMYFVGGIHPSSTIQDTVIDAMLGNRGGWTPNQIPMYDDGTHGDQTANDGIWSLYFDLPRGVRIGYKYTWGNQGDLWTGTEEWPGNQRILEVADVNDDGYVLRADNFGDEASNKDLSNLNPKAGGTLDWDEDINGDGYPEAREVPVDVFKTCTDVTDDEFVTPAWVPALTQSCEEFVANQVTTEEKSTR